MKNLKLLPALLLATTLAAPSTRAADQSVWDEAFPQKLEGSAYDQAYAGGTEILLGAGTQIMFNGDNSMKILREERNFAEYFTRAQNHVITEKPGLAELARKERHFKELELYRTKGAGLGDAQKAEHAALKKYLAEHADEYATLHRLVEERRQALMAAEKIMVKPGVWMSPELAHRREMRSLYLKKFGIAGAALAIAADGALRVGAALSGRDAGYVPSAAIISTIQSRAKAAPANGEEARDAKTSMSAE
jgi:hypothetical protein